jgi:hypothetical protein
MPRIICAETPCGRCDRAGTAIGASRTGGSTANRIGEPEAVHSRFEEQADDLSEGRRTDGEHGDDRRVEPRIGEERDPDLL